MKRAERQRLKQNDLGEITRQVQEVFADRKRDVGWIVAAVLVVGAAALGYWAWHQREQQGAQKLLADAMVVQEARIGPPAAATGATGLTFPTERERAQAALTKFKAAADAYPTTDAGLFARYQEASTQLSLGNPAEAAKAYQVVIDGAGNRLYRADGAPGPGRGARARRAVRSGDHDLQGARAAQGRPAADRRHPDGARSRVSGRGPRGRRAADVQSSDRGVPGFAVQRGREARARGAEEDRALAATSLPNWYASIL